MSIRALEEWLKAECDGDWEQSYGVIIESVDNPGWSMRVDLFETQLAHIGALKKRSYVTEFDWQNIDVSDSLFEGSCSLGGLSMLIEEFLYFAKNGSLRP